MSKAQPKATRGYVDEGLDSARKYAESLFKRARERIEEVEKKHGDCIDDRLAKALQTIRPAPTIHPPEPARVEPVLRIVVLKYPNGRITVDVK